MCSLCPAARFHPSLGALATLLGALAVAAAAVPAEAGTANFHLLWTATTGSGTGVGSSIISADVGDQVTLGIFLEPGPAGVTAFSVSLMWDPFELTALGSGTQEILALPDFTSHLVAGVTISPSIALASSFDALAPFPGGGPVGSTLLQIGEAVFTVGALGGGGADISVGFFVPGGIDFCTSNSFDPCDLWFNNAKVIPEPTTASLLIIGIGILAVQRRRGLR